MPKLIKQFFGFVGFSGIGWLLDFVVFLLLGLVSENVIINNMVSSLVGVTFVFVFATKKIFISSNKVPMWLKFTIYVAYQLILIYLTSMLLGWINFFILECSFLFFLHEFSNLIAKIVVTPFTMVLNFMVMKNIIEKM